MEEVAQNPVKEDSWSPKTRFGRFLDRYFHISERGSSILKRTSRWLSYILSHVLHPSPKWEYALLRLDWSTSRKHRKFPYI